MGPDDFLELVARYGDAERHHGSSTDPDRRQAWDQRANRLMDQIRDHVRTLDPR